MDLILQSRYVCISCSEVSLLAKSGISQEIYEKCRFIGFRRMKLDDDGFYSLTVLIRPTLHVTRNAGL
jgi:hypothetical protein